MSKRIKAIFFIMFLLASFTVFFSLKAERARRGIGLAKSAQDKDAKTSRDKGKFAETYISPAVAHDLGLYIEGDFEGIAINDYGTNGITGVTGLEGSTAIHPERFPLTEGTILIYEDYWELQDPEGDFEIETEYTDKKTRVRRTDNLRTVEVISVVDKGPIKTVRTEEEDYMGIRTFDTDYLYPLKVGDKWPYTGSSGSLGREDNMYAYHVEGVEDVTVPAGTFKDCFKIVFRTVPDHTIEWFHPDIGIVKAVYRHHGAVMNCTSELREFSKQ